MENKNEMTNGSVNHPNLSDIEDLIHSRFNFENNLSNQKTDCSKELAEILFITSYPPRVCGIATYSHDLINVLNNKFSQSLSIKVCALENGDANYNYPDEVKF